MDFETAYQHLQQQPDDWEFRLVFADWLEDNHQPILAHGQRCQAWKKRHPRKPTKPGGFWVWTATLMVSESQQYRRLQQTWPGIKAIEKSTQYKTNSRRFEELLEVPPDGCSPVSWIHHAADSNATPNEIALHT